MSNPPYGGMPPAQAPWPPQGPPPVRQPSRLPLILTAALAVIAIIVAVASWFRPAPEPEAQAAEQQFSEQEVTEAKEAVCGAYETIFAAIRTTAEKTHADEVVEFALSIENELAFHAAGDYLQAALRDHPATPQELAEATRDLAKTYHQVVIAQLADRPETDIDDIKDKMGTAETSLRHACDA